MYRPTGFAQSVNSCPGEDRDADKSFSQHLEFIDLLFQQDYLQYHGEPPASLLHYFLSEAEIYLRFEQPAGFPCWLAESGNYLPDEDVVLSQRLRFLLTTFDLTAVERDLLLLALLPRLSGHYSWLPQSGMGEGVSRSLVSRLFSTSLTGYRLLQSALHPASPLFLFQLLLETKPAGNRKGPPEYMASEAVWHFLCGNILPTASRYPWTRQATADDSAGYPKTLCENICRLCLDPDVQTIPVVVLEGREQDGREWAMAAIFTDYQRNLLCVDTDVLTSLPAMQQEQAMTEIIRDALLGNAALLLEEHDQSDGKAGWVRILERLLPQVRLPLVILAGAESVVPLFAGLNCVHLTMPPFTTGEKAVLLQSACPHRLTTAEQQALHNLVQRYAFDPADIPQIVQEADYYRQIREPGAQLSTEDLRQTLARRTRKNFGKLAQRITPVRTFDDIIVSPVLKTQLGEILSAIRLRETVTDKNFGHKTGGKTGISALFYGDSGTGKTLAAEGLAQHLGVDLIKVDLSTVVNKYVGETEKNLARIFDLAQADSGVLFFDEADALFGKRSETKDAHDRHANIEVSYLLQRLESYPGLVILATNNRNHLDSAFNRRFTFITRFTYPDVTLRTQMWQSVWPATLELADDVDFSLLAARSELTGANIRNVALLAAVLAAEENSHQIHQRHIEHAISRELGKMGRLSL
ncbi:ATP-binding protein [Erwinia persicina]|uniref:ATP-binding protein n=1 Tax=Erwinia persicina TaxID=55211 RepID=A0A4U3EUS4_9GAMM|nr:AAA family ATPase [Erwinia persicina]MBD8109123.1 ATP-binding protein [Erwinia persicina]MBD8170099.1 ATP-binding protein [Erwinia persicina]MBD8212247.1 ATP-binding protein [Erwinia persicina]TKJ83642.1 ATP-binding protein [Erwinia persicina]